jgi:YlmC/YmxH family sporulation protein
MVRAYDLRQKEVINICNAERLGYISDVEICFDTGNIEAIIIPRKRWFFRLFSQQKDYVIPWEEIECVGEDLVLVRSEIL